MSRLLSRRTALRGSLAASLGLLAGAAAARPRRIRSNADAGLLAHCAALHAIDAEEEALCRAHPGLDCDQMPGWDGMEARRSATLAAIAATPATTTAGALSKCRVQMSEGVRGDGAVAQAFASSIATDLERLHRARCIS